MNVLLREHSSETFFRFWIIFRGFYTAISFACASGLLIAGYTTVLGLASILFSFMCEGWITYELFLWKERCHNFEANDPFDSGYRLMPPLEETKTPQEVVYPLTAQPKHLPDEVYPTFNARPNHHEKRGLNHPLIQKLQGAQMAP